MYRIRVEYFDEQVEQGGYAKEMNRRDVFEQVVENIDIAKLVIFINTK